MNIGRMSEEDLKSMLRGIVEEKKEVKARRVEFPELEPQKLPGGEAGIDLLKDIVVDILVELGHCELKVSEILNLDTGSVVELNKLAGEEVEVYVNAQPFAKAEVVVINESFGIRINSFFEDMEEQ
ncbi:MAG: flagellar motor switch protein FliN [Clostridia bacterium]|nr:flagellar motor switch protein FliN [Clostridia bacterium]